MIFELTRETVAGLPQNGPTDPVEYYRRPLIGWLFRERINRGLRLLPTTRYDRALEIGYGAGAVQFVLSRGVRELHGVDLDADPAGVNELMHARGTSSELKRGTVYDLPYDSEYFDLVVSFSVFEHLTDYERALSETSRVLRPGGHFLLGMPAVNRMMEVGFRSIGFRDINHHHVTTPAALVRALPRANLGILATNHLNFPLRAPFGARLYYNWLIGKTASTPT